MYARFLGNSFASVASVKNYLSGAKSWVSHHQGDPSAFASQEPADVVKYIGSSSNHMPMPAYPISTSDLGIICQFLDSRPHIPLAFKACILIGFASFLRASNITSPTLEAWGGAHTLRVCDISDTVDGLTLFIHSTKTTKNKLPLQLRILPAQSSTLCPVQAWRNYKDSVNPWPFGPAFMINASTPVTPRPTVNFMRLALASAGHSCYHLVSMHSLRRGGAQLAYSAGADSEALMRHGTWKTKSGLDHYLPKDQSIIPQIIAASLAQ